MKFAITVAFAAASAVLLTTPAVAGQRTVERFRMVAPLRSPDADARGTVKVVRKRGSAKTKIKLRGLTPGAEYEVRDGTTNAVLGTVSANRHGRSRLKVRHRAPSAPAKLEVSEGDAPDRILVRRADSQRVVLMGDANVEPTDPLGGYRFGDAYLGGAGGANVSVGLFADEQGRGEITISLDARAEGMGRSHHELSADTSDAAGLPGGAEDMDELAGKPFAIVDGRGDEVVAGTLPELRTLTELLAGGFELDLFPAGAEDEVEYAAPFTFRVALDGESLEDAGQLVHRFDEPADDPSTRAFLGFGTEDGVSGSVSLFGDAHGESVSVALYVPGEDGFAQHTYTASTYGDLGTLPLGAETAQDLIGSRVQVRDASGTLVVERLVPALGTSTDATDGAVLQPGAPPYTVWFVDGEGIPQLAGTTTERGPRIDWWDADFLYGGLFYGEYLGSNGSLSMSIDGDVHSLAFSLLIWDGDWFGGDTHRYTAMRTEQANDLPFGVDSAADLTGRAFEVRNALGTAIISGALPEMLTGNVLLNPDAPLFPDGEPMLAPGDGPFSFWIEDAEGVLTQVAELTHIQ